MTNAYVGDWSVQIDVLQVSSLIGLLCHVAVSVSVTASLLAELPSNKYVTQLKTGEFIIYTWKDIIYDSYIFIIKLANGRVVELTETQPFLEGFSGSEACIMFSGGRSPPSHADE